MFAHVMAQSRLTRPSMSQLTSSTPIWYAHCVVAFCTYLWLVVVTETLTLPLLQGNLVKRGECDPLVLMQVRFCVVWIVFNAV
jgi:hypothetical protein